MANTSFYTGTGANSTDVSSVVSNKTAAAASEAAAAVSEANAASSATSASTSATAASTSATAASTSATAANTSKVAAETAQAASETAQAASEVAQAAAAASAASAASSVSSTLLKANNLSGLANVATARTNLGLSTIASTGAYSDLTGAPTAATTSAAGLMSAADKIKLDSIETSATADQTNAEIKAAYEANSDTNAFTNTYKLKIDSIEQNAKDDQTGSEIKALYEANSDTNAFTDTEKAKLAGIATSANNYAHPNHTGEVTSAGDGATVIADNVVDEANLKVSNPPTNNHVLTADDQVTGGLKWSSVGSGDLVASQNLSDVANAATARSNLGAASTSAATTSANGLMSSSDKTKLDSVEANATADQTAAEIKTAYESNSNTNAFSDTEKTKLSGIATNANNYIHPNHTGEVTSTADGATVIADNIIGEDKIRAGNNPSDGQVLKYRPHETGKLKWEFDAYETPAQVKAGYESNSDTNAFTDTEKAKLSGIESGATADQTASEIKTAYENNSDTNAFTDAEKAKLSGIATGANNYVHPNHTGEVTSTADGATVITDNVVDEANLKVSNTPTDGNVLVARSGNTGGMTWEATGVNRAMFSGTDTRDRNITNEVLTTSNFFNQIDYNVGSCFNGTNGRFTAPVAGYYFCSVHVADASSTSKEVNIRIRKNGQSNTGPLVEAYNQTGNGAVNVYASCIIQCSVNDYIDFEAARMNIMGGVQHKRFIIYLMG